MCRRSRSNQCCVSSGDAEPSESIRTPPEISGKWICTRSLSTSSPSDELIQCKDNRWPHMRATQVTQLWSEDRAPGLVLLGAGARSGRAEQPVDEAGRARVGVRGLFANQRRRRRQLERAATQLQFFVNRATFGSLADRVREPLTAMCTRAKWIPSLQTRRRSTRSAPASASSSRRSSSGIAEECACITSSRDSSCTQRVFSTCAIETSGD